MTSLRPMLNCVHSASFEAIIANETWESKIVQGIYSLLYFCWNYGSAERLQLCPPHFPPHASVEQGICESETAQ